MLGTVIEAIIKAGIPIGFAAFIMFSIAYAKGYIKNPSSISELKKEIKKVSKNKKTKDHGKTGNKLMDHWFDFGGGFYGFVAMYTFFYFELGDLSGFVMEIPGLLGNINAGSFISTIIGQIIESIVYFFTAAFWPFYWGGELDDPWIWLIVVFVSWEIALVAAQRIQRNKALSPDSELTNSKPLGPE